MRAILFYHSLVSDWNHGNAHFLRGVVSEMLDREYDVTVFEPRNGWSRANLVRDHGPEALEAFRRAYPRLRSQTYDSATLNLDETLRGADLVIVHEWNDHDFVARIGHHHAAQPTYRLLFHDTHHRSVTDPASMAAYDLQHYDGVLAFGDVLRDLYIERGWTRRAWTWHEAADARMFYPRQATPEPAARAEKGCSAVSTRPAVVGGDLVWIGNWGDEERSAEIEEFLLEPSRRLGLNTSVYGVRYPDEARAKLAASGVEYRGWLPNAEVPAVFARFKATVHIPRRPYLESLPGVPTIRPFEAMACGIPLVSARWNAAGDLFSPGEDFLVARDGAEMTRQLRRLMTDASERRRLAARGLAAIAARHTCAHRVDELIAICDEIAMEVTVP